MHFIVIQPFKLLVISDRLWECFRLLLFVHEVGWKTPASKFITGFFKKIKKKKNYNVTDGTKKYSNFKISVFVSLFFLYIIQYNSNFLIWIDSNWIYYNFFIPKIGKFRYKRKKKKFDKIRIKENHIFKKKKKIFSTFLTQET